MCRIVFAPSIQRHVSIEERELPAATLTDALEAVFVEAPKLRGYLLDDQGGLRRHLTIFIDGLRLRDRAGLSDALDADSEVYVVQALSGG
ncbi:MoaD/ThiS family protein [Pseudomonas sp. Pseusp97]|uniref:MoaD/ThiS family protein n=1 Tax=Pseudomonas sp. Pseusp97 TaxID=3243065 RepID=UPI0039A777F1